MKRTQKQARYAGWLYLFIATLSPLPMLYIPSQLIVHHDMAETAQHILDHLLLFRLGISLAIIVCILEILLSILLYQTFKKANQSLSLTALAARLTMTVIQALNATLSLTILTSLTAKESEQTSLYTLLNFQESGTVIWQIFFGVHLIALGLLVYQSGYVHKLFGLLLLLASLGYLAKSFSLLFSFDIEELVSVLLFLSAFGELAFAVRLLIKKLTNPQA
ncbi:DUF4386 domain-containing protein [Streptococcus dentiloxodontae]